jgi:hypothetical protein
VATGDAKASDGRGTAQDGGRTAQMASTGTRATCCWNSMCAPSSATSPYSSPTLGARGGIRRGARRRVPRARCAAVTTGRRRGCLPQDDNGGASARALSLRRRRWGIEWGVGDDEEITWVGGTGKLSFSMPPKGHASFVEGGGRGACYPPA